MRIDPATHALVRTARVLDGDTVVLQKRVPMTLWLRVDEATTIRVVDAAEVLEEDGEDFVQEEPGARAEALLEVMRYLVVRDRTTEQGECESDFAVETLSTQDVTVRRATPTMRVMLKHLLPDAQWPPAAAADVVVYHRTTLAWTLLSRYEVTMLLTSSEQPRDDDDVLLEEGMLCRCRGWLLPPEEASSVVDVDDDGAARGLRWKAASDQDPPPNALAPARRWCPVIVVARVRGDEEEEVVVVDEDSSGGGAAVEDHNEDRASSPLPGNSIVGRDTAGGVHTFPNPRDLLLACANEAVGQEYYYAHLKPSGGSKPAFHQHPTEPAKVFETRQQFLEHVLKVFHIDLRARLIEGDFGSIVDGFVAAASNNNNHGRRSAKRPRSSARRVHEESDEEEDGDGVSVLPLNAFQ